MQHDAIRRQDRISSPFSFYLTPEVGLSISCGSVYPQHGRSEAAKEDREVPSEGDSGRIDLRGIASDWRS